MSASLFPANVWPEEIVMYNPFLSRGTPGNLINKGSTGSLGVSWRPYNKSTGSSTSLPSISILGDSPVLSWVEDL